MILRFYNLFFFQIVDVPGVLGNILQSLATIFAIVFSISLVAIQLYSERLSHRLVTLYVKNSNFFCPFALNLIVLLVLILIISNGCYYFLADYGILLSVSAILSIIPFFIFTINFLRPSRIVKILLDRIKDQDILERDHSDVKLYRAALQPIEDIISSCAKNRDYATAADSIELIRMKMFGVLKLVNNRKEQERPSYFIRLLDHMSSPFTKLLENIAISANKEDAIEITIFVIETIGDFVERFLDARFTPAFQHFVNAIENIRSQALHRFSSEEYKTDFALLELAISDARLRFSQFMV